MLGIVKGTGYLMFRGNGLNAFNNGHAHAAGASPASRIAPRRRPPRSPGATSTPGSTSRVGGGMDAVLGFEPFTLAGNI